jgi:hypothetical protein
MRLDGGDAPAFDQDVGAVESVRLWGKNLTAS